MGTIHPIVREIVDTEQSIRWFGFTIEEAHGGTAVVTVDVDARHVNRNGMAHGGLIFSVADQAFAMAAITVLGLSATADAQITYLAPARTGDLLSATAHTTYHDDRRAVIDVNVTAAGETVALYRGTARALRRP